MLDLNRLKAIKLANRPPGQVLFANLVLRLDYKLPRPTQIEIEGLDNLPPGRTVIFAMNHPDRYNYWPFQYELYRRDLGFTATWVKGKYYEHPAMAWFMDACNNIPLPSRGYVISVEFRKRVGAAPTKDEYRVMRDLVDGALTVESPRVQQQPRVARFLKQFGGGEASAAVAKLEALFDEMISEVVRLSREALQQHRNHLLVFPQGTRSVKLLPGKTGMMQMAWHLGHPIVPVGCNGSERCYPGNSPLSRGGKIVYRIGEPLELDGPELSPHRVPADVAPLSREATARYGERYQAATDVVMEQINLLLDPPYRFADAADAQAQGASRFL